MLRRPALLAVVLAAGLWSAGSGTGFAGSGNTLYLLQDSSPYGVGESFQSDQSSSTNSSIGSPLHQALQSGSGDSASLTIDSSCAVVSSSCGHADLTQEDDYLGALADHPDAPSWLAPVLAGVKSIAGPNSTTVSVTGQGSAAVSQYGFGNQANISVDNGAGSITQVGLGNSASLSVTPLAPGGESGSFALNQLGVDNSANLAVSTPAGTSSSYTQIGVGLTHGSSGAPVVISSTRSVDVTQTNFGTFGH